MGWRVEQLKARELILLKELADVRRELRAHKEHGRWPVKPLSEAMTRERR